MTTLVFILVILEGTDVYNDSMQYGSIDKCSWYAEKINFYNSRQTRNNYTDNWIPKVITRGEE